MCLQDARIAQLKNEKDELDKLLFEISKSDFESNFSSSTISIHVILVLLVPVIFGVIGIVTALFR